VDASSDFPHPIVLVSGVRSDNDILRGEETQLIGARDVSTAAGSTAERTFVFPGTHSKHIQVRGSQAVGFQTYMTGEFFALLSRQSVLAHSVAPNEDLASPENLDAFELGVRSGAKQNLLHACFGVRTRAVLSNVPPAENLHYLSGLLIGAELREVARGVPLTLVGSGPLLTAYRQAFRILANSSDVNVRDADECLIAGQLAIATRAGILQGGS
jgi:2-dehydro-3-deoxygalactonokinase